MRKYVMLLFIIVTISVFYFWYHKGTTTTMKYFPIDDRAFFLYADTNIHLDTNKEKINWNVESISSEKSYLRQDVSLMYENAIFKGIQSKWEQNSEHIRLHQEFNPQSKKVLQSISFHHGEIHYPDEKIKSIQKMTRHDLYVISSNYSFQTPVSSDELEWKIRLNNITAKQVMRHWNDLIHYFNIDQKKYELIPFVDLAVYDSRNFSNLSVVDTKKIVGQLWEGLYNHYILLLTEKENQNIPHFMPVILFAKDNTHLLVLFELNNEKQKLIQNISYS